MFSIHIWEINSKKLITPKNMKNKANATRLQKYFQKCKISLKKKIALITFLGQHKLLNKQSEVISKYRHENKILVCYLKIENRKIIPFKIIQVKSKSIKLYVRYITYIM